MQKNKAFTLIEILITSLILAIITSIGIISLFNYQKSSQLNDTTKKIAIYLEFAKTKSISQENGYQWGLHLEHPTSGQSFWQIFYSSAYSSSSALDRIYLPSGIEFYSPQQGYSEDFTFEKSTGYLSSDSATSTILYSLADENLKKTITVNDYGVIDY